MTKDKFVGAWKLLSWENRAQDGSVVQPFGSDTYGLLIYSQNGYMSVVLTSANRPNFDTSDVFGGTPEERVGAAKTYMSYFGKYEVQEKSVIHHVEGSLFPNWLGTSQERFYEFVEDRKLVLSTASMLQDGKQQASFLVWQYV